MTCDETRAVLSAAADGEVHPEIGGRSLSEAQAHEAHCAGCTRFRRHLDATREHLTARVAPPPGAPDLATAVLARVRAEAPAPAPDRRSPSRPRPVAPQAPRRPMIPAAAVFVAAALAAALLVHTTVGSRGPGVTVADLPDRVVAAQHDVPALAGRLTLVERGWNPAVPERRFTGRLEYAAPETLRLTLVDRTRYPAGAWAPNDLRLVVDDDRWSVSGLRDCPSPAQPACTPPAADRRSVVGRAPFAVASPSPLELVMPVQSFALAGTAVSLPPERVDGRPTVGIETTAAQIGPLLEALRPAGNLRRAHPADPVDLRLDEATLVPVRVTVRAGEGPDREAWAENRGYADRAGDTIVDLTVLDLEVPRGAAVDALRASIRHQVPDDVEAGTFTDAGFRDGAFGTTPAPVPSDLPDGLAPHRAGTTSTPGGPTVHLRSWSDGRAWLTVAATAEWPGGRLFGDLGTAVRPLALGNGASGYLSEDGERIGIHTDDLDIVVSGSVAREELVSAAKSLDVAGRPVPDQWAEAASADVAAARRVVSPLVLPGRLDGFAAPALRIERGVVTAVFAGAGDRSFVLEQAAAAKLPPPVDADGVAPVEVRGRPGRYVLDRGEVEWHERGVVVRLRSLTLGRPELLAIAEGLRPA